MSLLGVMQAASMMAGNWCREHHDENKILLQEIRKRLFKQ